MIKLSEKGVFLASNNEIIAEEHFAGEIKKEEAKKGTIAWSILSSHNTSGNMDKLKIKFDSLASHDITFVGIVNRPGFPGECFICELRLPDHYFRWKHNKLFLLLPEE
ncbi:hypothetical protein, partial [Escherichia coli]|uniref:hypothetical protein n=1 Tax=Escherichia coli TaxID=562 RepID=UPI001D143A7D